MSGGNALDILLDALPTSQAAAIVSQFSLVRPTAISTEQPNSRPTSSPAVPSSSFITSTTSISSSSQTPSSTSTSSQIPSSTSSSQPISTAQSANAASSQSAAPVASFPAPTSAAAIAGITIGSVAAAVLIFVLAFYLYRRHRQRKWQRSGFVGPAPSAGSRSSLLGSIKSFGRRKPKVYPEVAWLYDPVRPVSRDGTHTRHGSNESGPRLGANAPWSSRPSTSNDERRPVTPSMAELPGSPGLPQIVPQQSLSAGMFQPPQQSRSPSPNANYKRFSRPFVPVQPVVHREEEEPEDIISPLLPPPARFSSRSPIRPMRDPQPYNRAMSPEASGSREGEHLSKTFVVSPDGEPPVTRMGRAF